jgi:uncharacterized protein
MARKFLVDTNVFLEILLNQEKDKECKEFLNKNIISLCISDFSLHSIGIILCQAKRLHLFDEFLKDILININILHIPVSQYIKINEIISNYHLDFDDSYQYLISQYHNLSIVTLDKDFNKINSLIEVIFI